MADSQDECVQNSFEVSAAMFSLDLVAASYQHVQFLKRVHQAGLSLRAPTAEEFRRYEQLWLPLLASASENVTLCPPLDVAWLWHCHRLAPASYARACMEIFGASHALDCPAGAFQAAEQASYNQGVNVACVEQTQALWMKMYPHEPFFPTERSDQKVNAETGAPWIAEAVATVGNNGAGQTYGVISGFDVVESCERQATFLWQMSGPRYSDPAFLQEGVLNYARFLNLMKLNPKAFAVPTYQIDLMWHTHMLASSAAYHRDAGALTGRRSGPNHDDSVNDRSHAATKLNVCTATTKQLWKRAYGQDYFCPGGMFRGDPPSEYWHRAWQPTVPGPALVNAAIAKSTGVVSQQPVSAETLLHDAICSDADVVGADSESIITSMADCLGMRPASPRAVLGGAPPGEAITDATVTEVKAPFNSARSDAVVAQAIVVPSTTIYGCDANWLKTQPPFIKAAQKSTTKNVNANPQRTGYVFGQVQLNEGYWRLDTTQADEVIVRKLTGRLNTLLASGDNRDKALAELPLKVSNVFLLFILFIFLPYTHKPIIIVN